MLASWGDGGLSNPPNRLRRLGLALRAFKGTQEGASLATEMGVSVLLPHGVQAAQLSSRPLQALSCCLVTQFVREVTEGEAGERPGHLFFISSSLICRKSHCIKQGAV